MSHSISKAGVKDKVAQAGVAVLMESVLFLQFRKFDFRMSNLGLLRIELI